MPRLNILSFCRPCRLVSNKGTLLRTPLNRFIDNIANNIRPLGNPPVSPSTSALHRVTSMPILRTNQGATRFQWRATRRLGLPSEWPRRCWPPGSTRRVQQRYRRVHGIMLGRDGGYSCFKPGLTTAFIDKKPTIFSARCSSSHSSCLRVTYSLS